MEHHVGVHALRSAIVDTLAPGSVPHQIILERPSVSPAPALLHISLTLHGVHLLLALTSKRVGASGQMLPTAPH
jgi:hypothetical protein